jgi:hypothetical protein
MLSPGWDEQLEALAPEIMKLAVTSPAPPSAWRISGDGDNWRLVIPRDGVDYSYEPFFHEIDAVVFAYKLREPGDGPVTLVVVTELQQRMAVVLGFVARTGE